MGVVPGAGAGHILMRYTDNCDKAALIISPVFRFEDAGCRDSRDLHEQKKTA